jgi:hypothetical protein
MDLGEVLGIDSALAAQISDVLPEWLCRHPGARERNGSGGGGGICV